MDLSQQIAHNYFRVARDSLCRIFRKVENKRNNLRYFCFGNYENKTKSIALMEAASHAFSREYSGQQDGSLLKTRSLCS